MRGHAERPIARDVWHQEPVVIVSSHLVRRADRQKELLEVAEPYDLIILDGRITRGGAALDQPARVGRTRY